MIDWSKIHTAEQKAAEAFTEAFASATTRNNDGYESAIAAMTAAYPSSEIATWERQRAEAVAWEADNAALTPWLDIAALARGIDREAFISKTLEKASLFALASAYLTGTRQRYEGEVNKAALPTLLTMEFDYTLPASDNA